ncbi:MAG: sugar ABC transporter substrate-binding protein, partial [Fusobacteriaceae bacterium]
MKKLFLLSLVSLSLFGGQEAFAAKKKIYYIPIVDVGSYWKPMGEAAKAEADKLGYDLVMRTSAPSDAQKNEKHLGFIQEAIDEGAAGIAIAPMDPDMFDRKVKEAFSEKIPVVTFDADVKTKANRIAYIGTDNMLAGKELGKRGAEYLKEKGIKEGKIALVATNLTQTTMVYRMEGIKAGFNEVTGADSQNFKWLEEIQDNDQAAESKRQLEAQIISNPDMVAVFSLGSEGPDTGVMEAIKTQGVASKISHFGFDYTPTWENGIKDNLIAGIVDQDSATIGKTLIQILDKKIKKENVDDNYPVPVKWIKADEI